MLDSTFTLASSTQQTLKKPHKNRVRLAGRRVAACFLLAGMSALLSGCARGVATTIVRSNGSWVRKVTYHGSNPNKEGNPVGTTVSDAFTLPTGAGWKITHEDTKDEAVTIAEKTLEVGETLHGDITVKGGKKQPMPIAVNDVTVQKVAPGVFKYMETLHWKGLVPKDLTPSAEMIATFKQSLPPALATDANARDLTTQIARDLWRVMFGPGEPLISDISALMTHPELLERRIQKQMAAPLEQHLEAKFGAQMTSTERRAVTLRIIHNSLMNLSSRTQNAGPGNVQPGKEEDTRPGASLFIAVKLPGRITVTNGERDDLNGEVFWALYPEAAALGDVTMTATCDINAQSASR